MWRGGRCGRRRWLRHEGDGLRRGERLAGLRAGAGTDGHLVLGVRGEVAARRLDRKCAAVLIPRVHHAGRGRDLHRALRGLVIHRLGERDEDRLLQRNAALAVDRAPDVNLAEPAGLLQRTPYDDRGNQHEARGGAGPGESRRSECPPPQGEAPFAFRPGFLHQLPAKPGAECVVERRIREPGRRQHRGDAT